MTRLQRAMKRFEYKAVAAEAPTATVEQLDEFGQDGWQLVQIYPLRESEQALSWIYLFMRECSEITGHA